MTRHPATDAIPPAAYGRPGSIKAQEHPYRMLNNRVAISCDLLQKDMQYSRTLLRQLSDLCRSVYVVADPACHSRNSVRRLQKRLEPAGMILCGPAQIGQALRRYQINLYISEPDTDVKEIYALVQRESDRLLQEAHARKAAVEDEIERGERGSLPSEQRPWEKFSAPAVLDPVLPEMSIYQYLYQRNRHFTRDPALRYFGKHITYGELFAHIDGCADALLSIGVSSGDTVTLALPNIPESVYLIYALAKIGAVADMIDPRRSPLSISGMLRDAGAKVFIALDSEEMNAHMEECVRETSVQTVVHISPAASLSAALTALYRLKHKPFDSRVQTGVAHMDYSAFLQKGHGRTGSAEAVYTPGADAVIVYTSGTTGKPKGIRLSHDAINASACVLLPFIEDMQPDDTFLGMMPFFMSFGVVNGMHYPLIVGQELILIPQWSEDEFPQLLQKHRPNHVSSVPKCWSLVADSIASGRYTDFSFLKTPMSGADALPEATHQRINTMLQKARCRYPLSNGYGASQVCAGVVAPTYDPASTCSQAAGIPVGNTLVSIFDPETRQELPYQQDGEIWIASATAMSGYLNGTPGKDDFCQYRGRQWWRTGDIGHMDRDGHLFVVGRITDAIATKSGTKISPGYITEAILSIGAYSGPLLSKDETEHLSRLIRDCVVVGVEQKDGDLTYQLPVAYVVLAEAIPDTAALAGTLSAYIGDVIDKKHIPSAFHFQTDDLPLTPAKKVDIRALKNRGADPL